MQWMITSARRALWLVVLGAVGGTAYTWWRDRQSIAPIDPPEWPPLRDAAATTDTAAPKGASDTTDAPPPVSSAAFVNALVDTPDARSTVGAGNWVPPNDDGSCPDGYPIKANDNSGIYHVSSGRFYQRTKPERCYATAEAAEADGYRAAKS